MARKKDMLLDCAMAAIEIGISPSVLASWSARRMGPKFVRLGSEIYYKMSDVKKYIASMNKETREAM